MHILQTLLLGNARQGWIRLKFLGFCAHCPDFLDPEAGLSRRPLDCLGLVALKFAEAPRRPIFPIGSNRPLLDVDAPLGPGVAFLSLQ